jgi:hypothetical protein
MQNKSSLTVLILLTLLFSCRNNNPIEKYYKFYNTDTDSLIVIDHKKVSHVKANLYMVDDTISLGVPYFEQQSVKNVDAIELVAKGKLMFNSVTNKLDIDTSTYCWLVENLVAKDKNTVFAFPRMYFLPTVKTLKLNASEVVVCDKANTYLKDSKLVYCIPADSYLDIESAKFTTVLKNGVYYGTDSTNYYYWDKIESPDNN